MATIRDFFVKQGAQANATLIAGVNLTNQLTLSGGVSGTPGIVSLSAVGGDTNISVNVVTKGTGQLLVNGNPITVSAGGTNGQIQYNNSGAFGGLNTTGTFPGSVVMQTSASITTPTIAGGTHTAITSLGIRNIGAGAFDLSLATNQTMTAGRTLTFVTNDASRAITMAGNLAIAGDFTTTGAFSTTLQSTASTVVTLPTSGTLATLANTETLSNKTLTTPQLNGPTFGVAAAVTAGTNAQGQGAMTSDVNVITTNASNPGGVTLPTGTTGRWITVINRTANPVNVYPATGGTIDGLALNGGFLLPGSGRIEFQASSTTQWYSSANNVDGNGILTLGGNLTTSGAFTTTFTMTGNTTVTFPTSGTLVTTTGSISGSAGSVANSVTFNNGGTGAASGVTYNGSAAQTISYNTVGAPSTTGTNASGTWGISISGTAATASATAAAVTFNNSNVGDASGITFNGGTARTISANTIGALSLSGGTMSGLLTLSADPTNAMHAVTKQYADALKNGLTIKQAVRAASTVAITITARTNTTLTVGGTTFSSDGVTFVNGDRILVKNSTTGVAGVGTWDNGIYDVSGIGTNVVLTRSTDADSSAEVQGGMFTFVQEGTTQSDSGWVMTSDGVITIGTTAINWIQFSGAGTYLGGNGIVKVANVFHFAQSSAYTIGDIFYASSGSTIAALAAVATGNVMISGGAGAAPAWGKVGLTTHITGTLPVANGGTGQSSNLTQGGVIYASSSTTMACSISGSSGNILISQGASAPTWGAATLASIFPDAWVKTSVKAASTAQQALSGTVSWPTIDGISTWTAGDRVLLRVQTTAAENGIYQITGTAASWTLSRVTDMDAVNEASGAAVVVDQGTANAGRLFRTDINATNTLGTTAMNWYEVLNVSHIGNASYVPSPTGTGASGTWGIAISGNAATATTATNATNTGITDDTATNASMNLTWVTSNSGNLPQKVTSTKLTFNPSTGILTATGGFNGNATTATTATNANNTAVTDDTTTNATMYPTWVTAASGNLPQKVSSTKVTFNPSTGVLTISGGASLANAVSVATDTTNASYNIAYVAGTGSQAVKVNAAGLTFNPSTNTLTVAGAVTTPGTVTGANVAVGAAVVTSTSGGTAVSGTLATNIDTFATATYRSARYTFQISDGTSYEVCDVLVTHNGTTPYVTTFGNVFTSTNSLGDFDAGISAGTLTLTYTAVAATSKTLKWIRTTIAV
jgi:hypothetical protein